MSQWTDDDRRGGLSHATGLKSEASSPGGVDRSLALALVRQRYTPFGGGERFLARAMEALRAEGVTLSVLTRHWQGGEASGCEVVSCAPPYVGRLWRDWGYARAVRRRLAERRFDLVQSHERIEGCDLYRAGDGVHREWLVQRGRDLSWLSRKVADWSPYHRYLMTAEKRLYESPRLRAVICNSRMVKEEIIRYFEIAEEKLHVIYSGVDQTLFHPDRVRGHRTLVREQWGIPEEAVLFLYVGSGFQRKGVPILVQAMAELPERACLLVVGKDKSIHRMRGHVQTMGMGGRIQFVGGVEEVIPFYGAADAFVLPTLYDPFPNVILEAMSVALPVITSFKCGAVDLIRSGENGLLADALDREQLVSHMKQLMQGEIRHALGYAGYDTVRPFSLKAMSGHLLDLYHRLLA